MNKNFWKNFLRSFFGGISLQEKINFARHLAVMTKSGMPILESLRLIKKQTPSKRFVAMLDKIMDHVNNGQSLSKSLEYFDYVFGDFFINMVKVGETSGNLSSTLLYLAIEIKKQREINTKVKAAMIYPGVILLVTVGITIFLTLFIFPKILPIFVSLKVPLPFTTKLVIQFLSLLQNYGLATLGALIFTFLFIKMILSVYQVHFWFDRILLKTPYLSSLIVNLTMANFTRSLSVLLKSGMNIVDALKVSEKTFHNFYYREQIEKVIESVTKGESMARYFDSQPKLFPPMFTGMIQVGESSGNLEENLSYLSEYYESEVDNAVTNLTTILEPFLLLFMGFLVGFIALSIITPIYKVTQGLQTK